MVSPGARRGTGSRTASLQFVGCVPLVPDQTRVMVTSMLPRVALEYGHT